MLLTAAYLMDELGYEDAKIVEIWNGVARYAEAIDSKLITMHKVCEIINNATGLNIRWNR